MKKFLYITLLALLFCSCSAEKRLARFLAKHPELHHVDTVLVHDTVYLPAETNTINLTLSQLTAMDSTANAASVSPQTASQDSSSITPSIGVATGRSEAALTALGNGLFQLSSTAKPDTIYRTDTLYRDNYITSTQYVDKTVYKQTPAQQAFSFIGVITVVGIVLLIFLIVYFALKRRFI